MYTYIYTRTWDLAGGCIATGVLLAVLCAESR